MKDEIFFNYEKEIESLKFQIAELDFGSGGVLSTLAYKNKEVETLKNQLNLADKEINNLRQFIQDAL
jgi:hypothetical protein